MRFQLNNKVQVKLAEEIMTGFLAASVVEGDCWKEEVALACEVGHILQGLDVTTYKQDKLALEQEFKKKNNLKQMPSKYRSAKSIICKALAYGVELLDEEGYPRGKTAVEQDIKFYNDKNYKAVIKDTAIELDGDKAKEPHSMYEKCYYAAEYLKKNFPTLSIDIEQEIIKDLLKGII